MAVVTTGFFDGVHLGHRRVLETVVSSARERGEEAVVVTFWPHPRTVLQQDARDFRLLTSLEEKKALLAAAGIDRTEVLPFTREFASLKADEYLCLLQQRYGASLIVMGYDNRIGSDKVTAREICSSPAVASRPLPAVGWAPPSYPAEGGQRPGNHISPLPVVAVEPCHSERSPKGGVEESPISSTRIRKALEEGDVEAANGMLGYEYGLHGVVVAGNRMGRTIGFPTANMQLYEPLKLVPQNGVYAVNVEVTGNVFRGMCNIGTRPTVGGTARTIETHILGFNEDIYGLPLRVRFLRRIRDERKFPSLDALRAQLEQDALNCKK
ncbi:MAG: bifunctional riboflavin kinase/FMN adenylyltransferase [Bacteroidales bacterium]|nr:bifunctional riboflavin kinase/FMN adenylyltransferase [Bacteroidales bacterium]